MAGPFSFPSSQSLHPVPSFKLQRWQVFFSFPSSQSLHPVPSFKLQRWQRKLCVACRVNSGNGSSTGHHKSFDWTSVVLPFVFPALGGVLFGYDIGATSGALISLTSPEFSGTDWYQMTSVQKGFVVSGSLYGALAGSLFAFNSADLLGRRRELISASFFYILGALVTSLAPDLTLLLAGRIIYGVGIGLAMHGAPLYIAETSPSEIRGTLVSLKEAFIVLGILLGYFVGSLEITTMDGWRIMYGTAIPIAAIMCLGMWWLPPSPRWLLLRVAQGKESMEKAKEKAVSVLGRLRGNISSAAIKSEIEETLDGLNLDRQEQDVNIANVFQGSSLKALKIGGGLIFFQQVTGQPSVLYYAASILQDAGFSTATDATRVSIVLGLFKFLMTGVAVFKVDQLGRRPLLIIGLSGIVFSLFLLAAFYKFDLGYPILAVISLLLYLGSYQVSFGPISWLIVSEIFPLRTRGRALSISVLLNFATNALVTFSFAPIQDLLGASSTFLCFGVIGVISLVFVFLYVPETKGLSLEEIESKLLKD